ncbi:MAG: ArnT family glycosyltransferase [Steroidobacteraceae bacterium]
MTRTNTWRSSSNERTVLLIIALTGLLHLALAGVLGLSVDESYSVAISRQIALSYFDHPPLHLWLVRAWARVVCSERPLLLRLPDVILFAASSWLMFRITASVYGQRAGMWATLALNLAPVFTLNTAIGILPDGPLVLFSLLTVSAFRRAELSESRPHELRWMAGAGCAAGLALLSKYTAIFTILSLSIYMLTARRCLLARPPIALAALVVCILFTPVLIWNYRHDWVSFAFQGGRAWPVGLSVERALLGLLGQWLYVLPWIALPMLYAIARALRHGASDHAAWLFAWMAVVPIAAFSIAGLWTNVLPHWPVIGWLLAFPLLGYLIAGIEQRRPSWTHAAAAATAGFVLFVVTLTATQAVTGWIDRVIPAIAASDPTLDLLDWRDLRSPVSKLNLRGRGMVLATVSWIDAGKADYALGGHVPVICVSSDPRHFAFMHDRDSLVGRDALIIAADGRPDWLRIAGPHFRRIDRSEDITLSRAGRPALLLHTAYGHELKAAGE